MCAYGLGLLVGTGRPGAGPGLDEADRPFRRSARRPGPGPRRLHPRHRRDGPAGAAHRPDRGARGRRDERRLRLGSRPTTPSACADVVSPGLLGVGLQLAADQHRLVDRAGCRRPPPPRRAPRGRGRAGRQWSALPRFVSARVCLPESATPVAGVPLGEAGVLDQPRRTGLDQPVRLRPGRRALGEGARRDDRVGEERAGAPGVVVSRVEHHALARAQAEHRPAYVGQRRTVARLDAAASGPARRRRPVRPGCPGGTGR